MTTSETYRIIRIFKDGGQRTIKRGLALDQAQAHCNDPETSSRTATSSTARRRTKRRGEWFDCYDLDEPAR
jgi:hypothetical protein